MILEQINNKFEWELDSCLVCDLLSGEPWVPFRSFFSNEDAPTEVLFDSETIAVIADIGPITEGHCLIVCKDHIPSFACIEQEQVEELINVKRIIKDAIGEAYTRPILFEHGAASFTKNAGCCIDHAHIHVIPTDLDILPIIKKDFAFKRIREFQDIRSFARKQGYLLYEDQESNIFIAEADTAPSQYFRRVLINLVKEGTPWNWRDHIRYEKVFNTKEKIQGTRSKLIKLLADRSQT